jgi:hypothetical protein
MAQLLNTDQDKEKQQPMESQPSLAGGQQASEIGGNQTPTPAAPQQQGSSRESGSGSGMGQRFQNLKKYIEGNQGSNLAQKVTGDIAKQQKQTAEALKKSQEGLQQKVGQEQQRLQSGQKLVGTGEGDLNLLGGQGKAEMFTTNTPPPTTVPTNDPTQTVTQQPQFTEIEPVEPVQPEIKAPDFSEYGQTAEERLKAFQEFQAGKARDIDFEDRFDRQQDVENLKSIGSIFSKAVGVTTLSSINNVNNRAINKMKIEAAMMGANIIYIGNVYQRGNQYGNENIPGNATMTSISGTAYSSMSSFDLNHAKNQLEKLEFVLLQIDKLNRNSFDKYTEFLLLQDEKYKPNTFHFQEVKIIDEELYVKTNQFKSKTGNLKVIFMDDKMLTLMERKGNSIYNYVLISENDTRIIKMKEIYQNKRQ